MKKRLSESTIDENKVYPLGVEDLYISMMTKTETVNTAPEYDEKIWRIPNIVKMGVKGNGSTKEKYASNKVFASVSRQTKHELSLTYVAFPTELWDLIKGVTSENGVSFAKADAMEMPYFALGFVQPMSQGQQLAYWYPKVQLSLAEEFEASTNEEEIEIKDISASLVATPLINNNVLATNFNSARKTITDLDVEKFMSKVIWGEEALKSLSEVDEPPQEPSEGE